MGRVQNGKWAGCTKSGKLINGQGAIRFGRVSNFPEKNKRACPFIRQVRVPVDIQDTYFARYNKIYSHLVVVHYK